MKTYSEKVFYRANLRECSVPLGLRSVGWGILPAGHSTQERNSDFTQILWSISGTGRIRQKGHFHEIPGGRIAIYPPDSRHQLSAVRGDDWEYRWVTMDGAGLAVLLHLFDFPDKPFHGGPCPQKEFERLAASLENPLPEGERTAGTEAYRFLSQIAGRLYSGGEKVKTSHARTLSEMPEFDPYSAELSVKTFAERSGVSRFTILRSFKQEFGVAPKQYQELARIRKAFALLRETEYSIVEVARQTGYANANYFGKVFRRKTGMTPSQFRRQRLQP